jgi:hypothetical protein
LTISGRGIYFNSIDSDGIDRTSYFSQFTGQSITITITQTGSTAIYSGDTNAFKYWSATTGTPPGVAGDGFVFGTQVGVPPLNTPSGNAVLIQSATTNWTAGLPVYISAEINAGVTPTPTPTPTGTPVAETPTPTETETPTPTPTPTGTPVAETPTPTLTQTPTPTDLSSITTYSISGCTNLNVLVIDLGPGSIIPGDVFYFTFTGATPSGCYSVIGKINDPIDDAYTTSSAYGGCNDCIDVTTTTYTISGCTTLNVLVADLGPGAFAAGDIYNMTFTGATPSGCYRIVNKIVDTPTDTGAPLNFYLNCDACEASLVTPTPTATPTTTSTPTPSVTNTQTPTNTGTSTPTPTPTPTSGATGNFNVSVSQVGPDVVWNGSGSFNLAALTFAGPETIGGGFNAGTAVWAIGQVTGVTSYSGVTTFPTSFGSGGVGVTSNTGSSFGILPDGFGGRSLYVPSGYTSNTIISGSSIYASQTIAGMGLSGGTYTWSWGSGGNASSLVMTITP